ncbi:MAG TPA: helix-turn-helix transcriptional regulator, partial [Actinomycetota bacterium]|nr:helix-turn-helix transcriptional regulator [Actinomycetota bacterium]
MSVVDLGASLRAERLRQGLSLRETARRLGISASALSQIETGKAHPSVGKLFDIVNLLNVSVDGLLAGETVVARDDGGFVSLQRAGEHEALELESGVRWH